MVKQKQKEIKDLKEKGINGFLYGFEEIKLSGGLKNGK